jgi:predicted ATPase
MDELFADTHKLIDRKSNEILFIQNDEKLTPYQLSSGEKQLLVILLTVLVENNEHYALIMDEPEISLHIDWQQKLIGLIRELNPNAQIILSTHSPALIMDGWIGNVTEVNEITNF